MMIDFADALKKAVLRSVPGAAGISDIARLSGGANQETWAFDAATPGGRVPLVLRRAPGGANPRAALGSDGSTAIPLDIEARVIEAARAGGVAAPRVVHVLNEEDGVGTGYIMERLTGQTIPRKILRDAEFDAVRPKLARQCGEILARLHAVDPAPLADVLRVMDGPTQLAHYRDIYDAYDSPHPVFELAFHWLETRLSGGRAPTLVHGDFRHGNLLVSPERLEAVLDWELCHIGDPVEDIGWICTNSWRFGLSANVVGGFGDLDDLLDAYRAAGGARIAADDVKPWIVFGSLKWGIMCMTMYRIYATGGDPSIERAAIGRRVSEAEIDIVNLLVGEGERP